MKQPTVLLDALEVIFKDDIDALDLTMIKLKLQDKEEGQGWSKKQCDEAEKEYKCFLALKRKYPEKDIVPNGDIDKFWHQHILDTAKYATDCQELFGYFLHHYPYFGMNGKQDAQNLSDAFEETKTLYKKHFDVDYIGQQNDARRQNVERNVNPLNVNSSESLFVE